MGRFDKFLRDINRRNKICWNCQREVSEDDLVIPEDEWKVHIQLCIDCYDLMEEERWKEEKGAAGNNQTPG
ncbi:hypothetical protein SAMN05216353_108108 [Halobacillus alkaliphilus]|uniref:Uncharacterized protein n=1 Tax=Halobacillus alkaliphilus TaxID=396056 RepID=A0A1I2LCA7_9BACI|nr:hypothetical protein [Halobacillus alkaliphilus]SFF76924.1 hypothetical protein SAMN05216353_108108 [Halobacillus alkaliphilus]